MSGKPAEEITQKSEPVSPLGSLLEIHRNSTTLGIHSLYVTPDGLLGISDSPKPSKHFFKLEGTLFNMSLMPQQDGNSILQIWSDVGYIPYSVEDSFGRQAAITAIRALPQCEKFAFVQKEDQHVLFLSEFSIEGKLWPCDLIYETMNAVRPAIPYIQLLRAYLKNEC